LFAKSDASIFFTHFVAFCSFFQGSLRGRQKKISRPGQQNFFHNLGSLQPKNATKHPVA
jgi:hypothetical protein